MTTCNTNYCPECYELTGHSYFCLNCGYDLEYAHYQSGEPAVWNWECRYVDYSDYEEIPF